MKFITAAVAGSVIAWLGWHAGRPAVLLLLALVWRCQQPSGRFVALLAYSLVLAAGVPAAYNQFFSHRPEWQGIAWWWLQAVLLASPALVFRFAWGWTACLGLALLPFPGVITWGSPLLAAGWWFPSAGIGGIMAMLALHHLLSSENILSPYRTVPAAALLLWSISLHMQQPQGHATPPGWIAINTHLGRFPQDPLQAVMRQQQLMRQVDVALASGARVVLLPESAANVWTAQSEYWWRRVILQAAHQNAVLLIGASRWLPTGQWQDVMLMRGAQHGELHARVPMPVGLWDPFRRHTWQTDWLATGETIVQNRKVAVSFCYEDLLVFPLLLSRLHGKPVVLLSLADDWFASDSDESRMQALSIGLQASLYGIPLLRALDDSQSTRLAL